MHSYKRIEYIDMAKGFAIFCVVLGHVIAYDLYGFDRAWEYSELENFIYAFHMPLFLFMSGLVSKSEVNLKEFPIDLWKWIRRLLIPFLLVGFVYSYFCYDNGVEFIERQYKHGYWYLWVLFVYYIVNYLICIIRKCLFKLLGGGKSDVVIWAIVALGWYISIHVKDAFSETVDNYLSLTLIVKYFPYFVLGNIIKRYNLFDLFFSNSNVLIVSVIVWMLSGRFTFPYIGLFYTMAQIIVIINICRKMDINNWCGKKSLLYIGRRTMYIYVFHYFFIQMMKTTFFYDFLPEYSNVLFDLILAIVPTVVSVWGSLAVNQVLDTEKRLKNFIFG